MWGQPPSAVRSSAARQFPSVVALLFLLALSACHRKTSADSALKRYPFTGHIITLDPSSQSARINGDDIPGFMDAMAMSYKIKDAAEFKQLAAGDAIAAEVVVAPPKSNDADTVPDYWLEKVRVTAHAKDAPAKPSASLHLPAPGEQVPDFAFTNQDGRRISLSQYRGKTLLVTFIYTRCPFPDYCPRVSHEFAAVYHQLDPSSNKIHLLSLSFDPAHDSPKVLREYARSVAGTNDSQLFRRWEFATARAADLPRLASFFAFAYKEEEGTITHSLSTAVIGPDGKLISWRHGSDWHAADLLKDASSATT
jgi:protein SCO1